MLYIAKTFLVIMYRKMFSHYVNTHIFVSEINTQTSPIFNKMCMLCSNLFHLLIKAIFNQIVSLFLMRGCLYCVLNYQPYLAMTECNSLHMVGKFFFPAPTQMVWTLQMSACDFVFKCLWVASFGPGHMCSNRAEVERLGSQRKHQEQSMYKIPISAV